MYLILDRATSTDPTATTARWAVDLPAPVAVRAVRLLSVLLPAGITNPGVAPAYIVINISGLPDGVITSAPTSVLGQFVIPVTNVGAIIEFAAGAAYDQVVRRNPGAGQQVSRFIVEATDALGAPITYGAPTNWRLLLELSD